MTSKDWKWIAIACLLVLVAYQAGKYAGKNSAESRSRESELAFQKGKEATRKDEFAKLLRIQEEEKREAVKRRREAKAEERDKEAIKLMDESTDRQMALIMKYLETMQNIQCQPSSIGGSPFSSYTTKTPRQGRISSIIGTKDNHSALIGTKLVREGDIIDGVTVFKIYKDEVEFEKDGKRWTQKIGDAPDPAWR